MTEMKPPEYFERVVNRVKEIKKFEKNPILKGLFTSQALVYQTVKNPDYVISELLQNADDCHASSVKISIQNDEFIFEHNGEDFNEKEFTALCSIAESSKTFLHTIGFRGIGFKSCFSLGDEVKLKSPTLSVLFYENDCTNPHWVGCKENASNKTRISIKLRPSVMPRIMNSYDMWKSNPKSLLFFKHIDTLEIDDKIISIKTTRTNRCKNSYNKIIQIKDSSNKYNNRDSSITMISSDLLHFPEEIIEEICRIRSPNAGTDELKKLINQYKSISFTIDILLEGEGDNSCIFVVLPTKEKLKLPFSINAPFILTPERDKLLCDAEKTNEWILEKTGELLVSSFNSWIGNKKLTVKERAEAYQLVPEDITDGIDGTVISKFSKYIKDNSIVLDYCENLSAACLELPKEFYNIWDYDELNKIFPPEDTPFLSREVTSKYVSRLREWHLIYTFKNDYLEKIFTGDRLPVPKNKEKLLPLIIYITDTYFGKSNSPDPSSLLILPTKEYDYLYSKKKICLPYLYIDSLPETCKILLEKYILFADSDFISKIYDCKLPNKNIINYLERVLNSKKSATTTEIFKVLLQNMRNKGDVDADDLISLGHFAADHGLKVDSTFPYLTRNNKVQPASSHIIADPSDILERIFPTQNIQNRLHNRYWETCPDKEIWDTWVASENSLLSEPLSLDANVSNGLTNYSINQAIIDAADKIAESGSKDGKMIWVSLFNEILLSYKRTGIKKYIYVYQNCCTWVTQFSNKPCLIGSDGNPHYPKDLYFRNEDTELLEGEIFLSSEYPTKNCAGILDLFKELGVRFEPGVPTALLNRLSQYSSDVNTSVETILNEYKLLEKILKSTSSETRKTVKEYIEENRLVYADDKKWHPLSHVYLNSTGGLPDKYVILFSASDLHFWRDLGVKKEPDFTDVIVFLKTLPQETILPEAQEKIIFKFLNNEPDAVLKATGCWLSLDGYWRNVKDFSYWIQNNNHITKLNLYSKYQHEIPWTSNMSNDQKSKIIDTYFKVEDLDDVISWRVCDVNADSQTPHVFKLDWLVAVGDFLTNNISSDFENVKTYHNLGILFSKTEVNVVSSFLLSPFIEDKRIGNGYNTGIYWSIEKKESIVYITLDYISEINLDKKKKQRLNFRIAGEILRVLHEDFDDADAEGIQTALYSAPAYDPENLFELLSNIFEIKEEEDNDADTSNNEFVINRPSIPQESNDNDNAITTSSPEIGKTEPSSISPLSFIKNKGNPMSEKKDDILNEIMGNLRDKKPSQNSSSQKPKSLRDAIAKKTIQSHEKRQKQRDDDDYSRPAPDYRNDDKYRINIAKAFDERRNSSETQKTQRYHQVLYEPNNAERNQLNEYYHGKCQLCGTELVTLDGKSLFCATNIIKSEDLPEGVKETEELCWNSLSLCPNCAALYKYCCEFPEDFIKQILDKEVSLDEAEVTIEIYENKELRKLRFEHRHFIRFQSVLKKQLDEEEQKRLNRKSVEESEDI